MVRYGAGYLYTGFEAENEGMPPLTHPTPSTFNLQQPNLQPSTTQPSTFNNPTFNLQQPNLQPSTTQPSTIQLTHP
ncbi:hypothetical protein BJP36_42025 [Moorena producens JHB]|uniref:Uncharacterized protein n=1 Tax=Moorena producens (strain JHB) TaxID=1454205 RepID=A0A9Q9SSN7_MOOP1|nr:hypothetical protein [Moorena producens]WAN68939.1 hypothetical protein BJP36_42025 [Moorena producens JHB]